MGAGPRPRWTPRASPSAAGTPARRLHDLTVLPTTRARALASARAARARLSCATKPARRETRDTTPQYMSCTRGREPARPAEERSPPTVEVTANFG